MGGNGKQAQCVMQQQVPGHIPPELVDFLFRLGLSSVQHWMASTAPWLALWDSAQEATPTHHTLRRQHSSNLWEPLVFWGGLTVLASCCCTPIGCCFSVSPVNGSHRLISSFPSQHRAIKLGIWFQVETQGHMLKERATRVQAFLVGTHSRHHHNGLLEEVSGCLLF